MCRHVYDNVGLKVEHHIYENIGELRDATPDLILEVKPKVALDDEQVKKQHLSVSFPTPLSLLHLKLCLVFSSWGPSLAMTKPRRVTPLSRLCGCQVWTELKEIHEP